MMAFGRQCLLENSWWLTDDIVSVAVNVCVVIKCQSWRWRTDGHTYDSHTGNNIILGLSLSFHWNRPKKNKTKRVMFVCLTAYYNLSYENTIRKSLQWYNMLRTYRLFRKFSRSLRSYTANWCLAACCPNVNYHMNWILLSSLNIERRPTHWLNCTWFYFPCVARNAYRRVLTCRAFSGRLNMNLFGSDRGNHTNVTSNRSDVSLGLNDSRNITKPSWRRRLVVDRYCITESTWTEYNQVDFDAGTYVSNDV